MITNVTTAALIGAVTISSGAFAQEKKKEEHFDVWLRLVDGERIETGSITEGTPGEPIDEIARIFEAEIGEELDFPLSAFEPGFQVLASPESDGAIFEFDVTRPLEVFTGDGFATADATMEIGFGPSFVETADGPVAGFPWATTLPGGLFHDHFDFTLVPPAGAELPDAGVYRLSLTVNGQNDPLVFSASDEFYILFGFGVEEAAIEEAEAFLEANLEETCFEDVDGNGTIDVDDLVAVLMAWGPCDGDCPADLNGDGHVGIDDVILLIVAWFLSFLFPCT